MTGLRDPSAAPNDRSPNMVDRSRKKMLCRQHEGTLKARPADAGSRMAKTTFAGLRTAVGTRAWPRALGLWGAGKAHLARWRRRRRARLTWRIAARAGPVVVAAPGK